MQKDNAISGTITFSFMDTELNYIERLLQEQNYWKVRSE